ncbi:MAG: peptidoglycan-binding domain-containing protein [Candidatus Paceibacteria bacterium]
MKMKKILSVLFLVFVFVLAPSVSSVASAQANPPVLGPACTKLMFNMKLGSTDAMTNGEVSMLQKFYVTNGFLNMPQNVPFGFFGPLTQQATINFQNQYNIVPAFGFVGPLTRAMIAHLTCVSSVPPVGNPAVPNNPVIQLNPGLLNNPNAFVNPANPNPVNPNPVNPNPVNPNPVNPNPVNPNPVNPVNPINPAGPTVTTTPPVFVPCLPPALFNVFTGAPCNPNVNPVNPVNPNPVVPVNPVAPVACTPASAPSITILTPNGGEKFMLNDQAKVAWTSCNLASDTVRISLINQTSANPLVTVMYPMINATPDDGSEAVQFSQPVGMPPFQLGTAFKIRIDQVLVNAAVNPVLVFDESDNLFTIN